MTESQTLRQRVLKHCLWMANFDPAYALSAAARYEQECELLHGLYARVKQTLERQPTQPPTGNRNGL